MPARNQAWNQVTRVNSVCAKDCNRIGQSILRIATLAKRAFTCLRYAKQVPQGADELNKGPSRMKPIRTLRFPENGLTPEDFKDDEAYIPQLPEASANASEELIDGLEITPLHRNADARGSLTELSSCFDQAAEPLVHVYQVWAEPGSIRAWIYHKRQFDRLAYTNGDFEIVLFDLRKGSPTHRMLNVVRAGQQNPVLIRIPPFVVHGVRNAGGTLASFINMPTKRYDPAHPDKSRLPKDDPRIPYSFDER